MDSGPADSPVSIPDALIEKLTRKVGNLQMLPAVAAEAMQVANNANCDLSQLASVIERDLKLTTFILRIANNALYAAGGPVVSLHQAVARLGLQRCRSFIVSASVDALSSQIDPGLAAQRQLLWRHGFLTAIFAMEIGHALNLGRQGEEFTAGLLHDLGRTLFAIAVPLDFKTVDPLDFVESDDVEANELRWLGASHAEFGAWFLERNELPEELVAAVRFHHRPRDAAQYVQLAAVTAAADHMANFIQCNKPGVSYDPASNLAIAIIEQSGGGGATRRFATHFERLLRDVPNVAEELASL